MASSEAGHFDLTQLQRDVLERFFVYEQGFYLTGGAALVGYYLHHRHTDDLDLFTQDRDAFERGLFALREVARDLTATVETRQHTPGFQRHVLLRPGEGVVVDLVVDDVPQLFPEKPEQAGIRLDPPEEILANKLTALLSRAEARDLVDAMALEQAGYRIETALGPALNKDGGCTPATLAWVLSQVTVPDSSALPGGIAAQELREWLDEVVARLRRAAAPPAAG